MRTIYLDNAATSYPKPDGVSSRMKEYMDTVGATINRSVYGAAQDAGLTTVLGQTSAGKAKYQSYFVLEQDYSALKLTVGEYGLMKSGSWQGVGIIPDQEVILPAEQEAIRELLTPHEDAQVQAAVDKLEESFELPGNSTTDPGDVGGDSTTDGDVEDTTTDTDAETTTTGQQAE